MGYGSHQKVHRKKLFSISDDRPVTVSVIDEEAKIRSGKPEHGKRRPFRAVRRGTCISPSCHEP